MELRHLRYFVAVAEEGSLLTAAQRRLHTSQPSLSRQIRDLESEVGVKLLERQARGVALTAAGKIFLDHARLALLQVEAATDGARRAEQPEKPVLSMGFLAGQEVVWLPHALRILREEAPEAEITLCSQSSPRTRSRADARETGRCLSSPGDANLWPVLQVLGKGATDRRAAGGSSPDVTQKNSAAGSCPRNLRQFSEDVSGIEIGD